MKRWYYVFLLFLSVAPGIADEDDSESDKQKPAYIAPAFVTPVVRGSPLLAEWFGDKAAIGKKWIKSSGKKDDVEDSIAKYNGEWEIGEPSKKIIEGDMGLIVKTQARHHAIATKLNRPFEFDGSPLIVQYEVKYEDGQECGGGYMKLLTVGAEKNLKEFTDKTPYTIMFGPDKCGQSAKVHFIVRFKNPKNGVITEHHSKQPSSSVSSYFDDHRTHLYTLIVRPDETFTVYVDNSKIISGSLLTDLEPSITPPAKVDDPADEKPKDWDDREMIDDPNAVKPDDWDENAPKEIEDSNAAKPDDWLEDEEALIPDPKAKKPDDWDDEIDGEWEAPKVDNPKCKEVSGCGKWKKPMIANPAYKGKWKAPRVKNPAFKGKWSPRQIDNPIYFEPHPYSQMQHTAAVGFELWTMSANIVVDNIYIGTSESAANDFAKQTFSLKKTQESIYEDATTPSQGIVNKLVSATEERPWLWAIYVLVVLVPVIGITLIFRRRKARAVDHKKTDEPIPDSEDISNLIGDDENVESLKFEETGAGDHRSSENSSRSPSRTRRRAAKKADLEEDEEIGDGDNIRRGTNSEEDGEAVGAEPSPKGKKVRQRRQD